ncbi:hypothetical protein HBB16_00260 [Pseudonocardia sp. MCCB 268]|nr:hypothetical protein [Pseudonocardia cytotoxica]
MLGSGRRWLERMHGFACDNLVSAGGHRGRRIVTASEQAPELLWGLRGGSGNWRDRVRAVPAVGHGGMLMYPREHGRRLPPLPRRHAGGTTGRRRGDPHDGAAGSVRAPPPYDRRSPSSRPTSGTSTTAGAGRAAGARRPGSRHTVGRCPTWRCRRSPIRQPPGQHSYLGPVHGPARREAIAAAVDRANAATSPASVTILAPYGGAVADVAGRRPGRRPVGALVLPLLQDLDRGRRPGPRRWVEDTSAALRPWTTAGMALSFFSQVDDDRVRRTFGADKYRRLVAVKDEYDQAACSA